MSKLKQIRTALTANPNVYVVHVEDVSHFPERLMGFSQTVEFVVAPKGGLYSAGELNDFMKGLVPRLKPNQVDYFHQGPAYLEFGRLYFDEKIGEETTKTVIEIKLTDIEGLPEMALRGFKTGMNNLEPVLARRLKSEEAYRYHLRRTVVSPFPSEAIAKDLWEPGKLPGSVYGIWLKEWIS